MPSGRLARGWRPAPARSPRRSPRQFTTLSPAGIAPGLPAVSITFDGSDTIIAALVRLANAIGGYAKVEDGVIYLFHVDTAEAPDPLDAAHPPLDQPHVTIRTDASQLRTRVYGKGYGEAIRSDVLAGETLLPIQDGVQFPVERRRGDRRHDVRGRAVAAAAVHRRRAPGRRHAGRPRRRARRAPRRSRSPPAAASTAARIPSRWCSSRPAGSRCRGRRPPSRSASWPGRRPRPRPAPPLPGVGPDQGTHDYLVTFVTAYGETNSGASS